GAGRPTAARGCRARDSAERCCGRAALLKKPLAVLNKSLSGREHLTGGEFTVADFNVARILAWGKMARLTLSEFPQVGQWLNNCLRRPAYTRVRDRTRR